ncbi:SNF2-related protein [Bacteroides pyogenes]|uniref:SNF2-related protein n=1 Tax=Bacteroides pyogenes TaxID=310300 RepID=UPI0018CAB138|nr:DEAD/DEAH box helicase [Bacteroides pyogenes]
MYKGRVERLYFNFRPSKKDVKVSTWFEIVNDKLTPCVRVENYRSEQLRDYISESIIMSDIYKQFHELIYECELERQKVPLHERLKDEVDPVYDERSERHQAEALRFLCSMKVSALNGDVGTMKSKIAIDLCASRYHAGEIKKVLVFLPVSTKKNFQEQISLWNTCEALEWKIVGHETMGSSPRTVFEVLKFVDNETQVIIDESHLVKNPLAKRSKRIKMICDKASYKIVMTGTPVTENVHNLYMQYAMLSDFIINLPNWLKFEEKYIILGGHSGNEVIGYKNLDHLLGLIEPYTYQIDSSVLGLKAKTHHKHYCDLNAEQKELYESEKEKLLDLIRNDEVRPTDIFQTFMRMQQITSGYYTDSYGNKVEIYTHKIALLKELDFPAKTVFFCKFIFEVDTLLNFFGKENCAEFSGRNPKTRDAEKDSFVRGDKKYFIATMQSGGTGLNGLQFVSNNVVFFSNSFSYFQRKQSIGRVDRKGQVNPVHVWDLLTTAKIDERIMSCLLRKNDLADEIKVLINDKTKLKSYIHSL